jgi:hypothetical protein
MLRAAAAVALALLALVPTDASAGRARKPVGPQGTVAHWQAQHAALPAADRVGVAGEAIRVGLGTARAFEKQEALGPVKGRGVFTGKSKATGGRKVTHLELVDELGDSSGPGMRIRSQDIDGPDDATPVERFFRPVATSSRAAVRHIATDGQAHFLLVTGRGIFDYHGGDFEGDPEPGLAPEPPAAP